MPSGTFRVHCGSHLRLFASFVWIDDIVGDPLIDIDLPVSDEPSDGYIWKLATFAAPAGEGRNGNVELLRSLSRSKQVTTDIIGIVFHIVLLCGMHWAHR